MISLYKPFNGEICQNLWGAKWYSHCFCSYIFSFSAQRRNLQEVHGLAFGGGAQQQRDCQVMAQHLGRSPILMWPPNSKINLWGGAQCPWLSYTSILGYLISSCRCETYFPMTSHRPKFVVLQLDENLLLSVLCCTIRSYPEIPA